MEKEKKAEEFLAELLERMGKNIGIKTGYNEEENLITIELYGDETFELIRDNAKGLNSLQYITARFINKDNDQPVRVLTDAQGYREKHKEELFHIALQTAGEVKQSGITRELEPMNAYERRIIHMALQEDEMIETESIGEEPERRLLIKRKKN